MPAESSRQVLRQLGTLFHCGVAGQLGDEELLEQFVAGTDLSAEAAFTALVDRHGAMVLGVCRRVLGNRHAAEDAFQATFLVLARKASQIGRREQLASWLYGVARRASMDARARAARQHSREKRLGIMSSPERIDEIENSELRSILDEELGHLPERHRSAIVLCELEGLSRREAAGRLGVSEGTLSSRLARAKLRLRERLTRRGLALSPATLTSALTQDAQALVVPPSLADLTIRVATTVATGSSSAGVASASVVTLTEGVLKAILLSKLKFAFLGLVTVALITTGAGVVAQDRPSDDDRLKNLERKVDRLLEVLGGSNRHTPAANPAPEARPEPVTAPARPPTQAGPSFAPVVAAAPEPPQPPAAPRPPAGSAFPAGPAPLTAPPPAPSGMTPPSPPCQPNSLAQRVDSLEQRLARLEQRMVEFERRLNGVHSSLAPTRAFTTLSYPDIDYTSVAPPAARVERPANDRQGNAATHPTRTNAALPPSDGVPVPGDSAPPPDAPAPASIPAGADRQNTPTEPDEPGASPPRAIGSGELPPQPVPAAPAEVPPRN